MNAPACTHQTVEEANDGTRTFHQHHLKHQQSASISGVHICRSQMTSVSVLPHESKPSFHADMLHLSATGRLRETEK